MLMLSFATTSYREANNTQLPYRAAWVSMEFLTEEYKGPAMTQAPSRSFLAELGTWDSLYQAQGEISGGAQKDKGASGVTEMMMTPRPHHCMRFLIKASELAPHMLRVMGNMGMILQAPCPSSLFSKLNNKNEEAQQAV